MNNSNVEAPFNTETGDDFRCRLFTAGETSAANVVPRAWHGRYVVLQTVGDVDVHFGFSTRSGAAIDANATATAAGASAGVGGIAKGGGVEIQRRIPNTGMSPVYFVRETVTGDGSTSVIISLVDELNTV